MSRVAIAETGDATLTLRNAVLLYRTGNTSHVYATLHDIAEDGHGRPSLLAGRPMTLPELATFAHAAAARTAYQGFLDGRVLYVAPNTLAWWCPPARRHVWFRADKPLGETAGETEQPALIFVAHAAAWFVFAVKGAERPTATTPLYHAPYFNVWKTGGICTGNVDIPEQPGPAAIAAYEGAFFRSHFTHPNHDRVVRRRGGAMQLWRDLLDGAAFPESCLIARKETLAEAIARIAQGD